MTILWAIIVLSAAGVTAWTVLKLRSLYGRLKEEELPVELEGQTYEVPDRTTPHPRFGVGLVFGKKRATARLGAGWYLNWRYKPASGVDLEFVPQIAASPGRRNVSRGHLARLERYVRTHPASYPDRTIWLVGNEIGYVPGGDARTPEQYADDYHRCHRMLKRLNPSYRVAIGPIILSQHQEYAVAPYVEHQGGYHYLTRVLEAYQEKYGTDLPVDCYSATAHLLQNRGTNVELLKQHVIRYRQFLADRGQRDKELIITEFSCGALRMFDTTPEEIVGFMEEAFHYLTTAKDADIGCPRDGGHLVQKWAWFILGSVNPFLKLALVKAGAFHFDFSQTSLTNRDGRFNCLGKTYAEYVNGLPAGGGNT